MPKFKFLRLLIGFPILVAGVALPCVDTWPWVFYFLGMMVALVGGYILTRSFNYELCGIGFAIIGFPLLRPVAKSLFRNGEILRYESLAATRKVDWEFRPATPGFVVVRQSWMFIHSFLTPRTRGLRARPFRKILLANGLSTRCFPGPINSYPILVRTLPSFWSRVSAHVSSL